ncbi:MAG: fused MFS/spermidine synthase [Halobacteria archaeon]
MARCTHSQAHARVREFTRTPRQARTASPRRYPFRTPVYLLGVITPLSVELSGRTSKGEASGRVFSLGTLGSIIGAFSVTFFLIPTMDVDVIAILLAAVSLAAGISVAYGEERPDYRPALAVMSVQVFTFLLATPTSLGITGDVVYETQSSYQDIRVVDDGDVMMLYMDGQPHSAMYTDEPGDTSSVTQGTSTSPFSSGRR